MQTNKNSDEKQVEKFTKKSTFLSSKIFEEIH